MNYKTFSTTAATATKDDSLTAGRVNSSPRINKVQKKNWGGDLQALLLRTGVVSVGSAVFRYVQVSIAIKARTHITHNFSFFKKN